MFHAGVRDLAKAKIERADVRHFLETGEPRIERLECVRSRVSSAGSSASSANPSPAIRRAGQLSTQELLQWLEVNQGLVTDVGFGKIQSTQGRAQFFHAGQSIIADLAAVE